ncbi:9311_t:CDS:2 [Funneliformis geosporum]|nr:9311_t:CDS:2 [Funneliformis geosporum]
MNPTAKTSNPVVIEWKKWPGAVQQFFNVSKDFFVINISSNKTA